MQYKEDEETITAEYTVNGTEEEVFRALKNELLLQQYRYELVPRLSITPEFPLFGETSVYVVISQYGRISFVPTKNFYIDTGLMDNPATPQAEDRSYYVDASIIGKFSVFEASPGTGVSTVRLTVYKDSLELYHPFMFSIFERLQF